MIANALNDLILAIQSFGDMYHDETLMIELWTFYQSFKVRVTLLTGTSD